MRRLLVLLAVLVGVIASAQTYPKYTTGKAKSAAAVKEKKAEETVAQPGEKEVMSPDFKEVFSKALQLYKQKEYGQASEKFTEALVIAPDDLKYMVLQFRGYNYLGSKDYNKAINDCTDAIEKTKLPGKEAKGHLHFVRAMTYMERNEEGDSERACVDYKVARLTGFANGGHMPGFENCK